MVRADDTGPRARLGVGRCTSSRPRTAIGSSAVRRFDVEVVDAFLAHLRVRAFAGLTVRSYPFHTLSFLRFCESRASQLMVVTPMDVCDFLEWLAAPPTIGTVVPLRPGRGRRRRR